MANETHKKPQGPGHVGPLKPVGSLFSLALHLSAHSCLCRGPLRPTG